MGKRKRGQRSYGAESSKRQKPSNGNDAARLNVRPDTVPAKPPHTPASQLERLLDPPAGLKKRQRKRWRKKRAQHLEKIASSMCSSQPVSGVSQIAGSGEGAGGGGLLTNREGWQPVSRSKLFRFASTTLLPVTSRAWHVHKSDRAVASVGLPALQPGSSKPDGQQELIRRSLPFDSNRVKKGNVTGSKHFASVDGESALPKAAFDAVDCTNTERRYHSSEQGRHLVLPTPSLPTPSLPTPSLPTPSLPTPSLPTRLQGPRLLTRAYSLGKPWSLAHAPQPTRSRVVNAIKLPHRTSCASKATSIPSHSDIADTLAGWKNFTAFMGDSSDDTDESEDDDEQEGKDSRGLAAVCGSVSSQLPQNPADFEESEALLLSETGSLLAIVDQIKAINDRLGEDVSSSTDMFASALDEAPKDANTSENLEDLSWSGTSISFAGIEQHDATKEVENISESHDLQHPEDLAASKQRPSSSSQWQANVGVKRLPSLSLPPAGSHFLERDPTPEPLSDTGKIDSPMELSNAMFIPDEDPEEVLRTIEEVSDGVFESTRPLPLGKPILYEDAKAGGQEERLVMNSFSQPWLTPTEWASTKTSKWLGSRKHGPLPTNGNVVCNSVRIPPVYGIEPKLPQPAMLRDLEQALQDDAGRFRPEDEMQNEASRPMKTVVLRLSHNALVEHDKGSEPRIQQRDNSWLSSSSMSERSRTPTPPPQLADTIAKVDSLESEAQLPITDGKEHVESMTSEPCNTPRKQRKMTGRSSKHFSVKQRSVRKRPAKSTSYCEEDERSDGLSGDSASSYAPDEPDRQPDHAALTPISMPSFTPRSKRKSTGKKSAYFTPPKTPLDPAIIDRVDFYNSTGKKGRVPAGVSTAPIPPISHPYFGIIQEKLWREPFWLLIAVTLLNQTTGRQAAPVLWKLKEKYITPEGVAEANLKEVFDMVCHLGFQNTRSERIVQIARAWVKEPPAKGKRWRTFHYPCHGDGASLKPKALLEEDADDCAGALEIGHIRGCGAYAYDSWRIFCRDGLRGVAADYNACEAEEEDFIPEWKKVLPKDKELRACLRWMWLREGWIWNCETGERRAVTEEERLKAERGEMEVADLAERKFAVQAAGVKDGDVDQVTEAEVGDLGQTLLEPLAHDEQVVNDAVDEVQRGNPIAEEDDASDTIVVRPRRETKQEQEHWVRRSVRRSTGRND